MPVTFQKMHGAGNDFVLVDARAQAFELDAATAARLACRHTGIGCDQLLVLRPADHPDCQAVFEVWNADGSRAEQCGNGVRCIGLYLDMRGETRDGLFGLQGPAGRVRGTCRAEHGITVDMGRPDFEAATIPFDAPNRGSWHTLDVVGDRLRVGAVSMGNPHALSRVEDLSDQRIARWGPALSRHPTFPNGCNAGFARCIDRHTIALRVFERGAGETRACGSGACAAVALLQSANEVEAPVVVKQAGGELIIDWPGPPAPMTLTGPAAHVFEGTLT